MVVGKIDATGKMNGRPELNVRLSDPAQFEPMLHAALNRLPEQPLRPQIAESSLRHFQQMVTAMRLSVERAEPGTITLGTDGKLKTVVDIDAGEHGTSVLAEIELTPNTPFNPDYTLTLDRQWQRTVDKLDAAGLKLKVVKDGKPTNRNQKEIVTYDSETDIPEKDRWGQARIDLVNSLLPVRDLIKRQLVAGGRGRACQPNRGQPRKAQRGLRQLRLEVRPDARAKGLQGRAHHAGRRAGAGGGGGRGARRAKRHPTKNRPL